MSHLIAFLPQYMTESKLGWEKLYLKRNDGSYIITDGKADFGEVSLEEFKKYEKDILGQSLEEVENNFCIAKAPCMINGDGEYSPIYLEKLLKNGKNKWYIKGETGEVSTKYKAVRLIPAIMEFRNCSESCELTDCFGDCDTSTLITFGAELKENPEATYLVYNTKEEAPNYRLVTDKELFGMLYLPYYFLDMLVLKPYESGNLYKENQPYFEFVSYSADMWEIVAHNIFRNNPYIQLTSSDYKDWCVYSEKSPYYEEIKQAGYDEEEIYLELSFRDNFPDKPSQVSTLGYLSRKLNGLLENHPEWVALPLSETDTLTAEVVKLLNLAEEEHHFEEVEY